MARFQGPDEIYGPLFDVVQSKQIFPDSKAFADARPFRDVAAIIEDFAHVDAQSPAAIQRFVEQNFELPGDMTGIKALVAESALTPVVIPMRQRIDELWQVLSREADRTEAGSTLIPLPHPYIVPGGRFREIYYWDSYFTMLGLADSGRIEMIENMVRNFAFLIDTIGFVPNGNRSYFCTRSQPPFFVLMVELLAAVKKDRGELHKYLPQLRREYEFWMCGGRALEVANGTLNRYWDDSATPRAESYAEDQQIAERTGRAPAALFRDIRAACESGWDFSSRWLAEPGSLASIRTTNIIPVDLNALLCRLEYTLAAICDETADIESAAFFAARAEARRQLLQTLFFDAEAGLFADLQYPQLTPTGVASLATAYPLFLGVATPEQAAAVADKLRNDFLADGGWRTSLHASSQQWDKPNGWAPLQWIVFKGLQDYGFAGDANSGAQRWVAAAVDVYQQTGLFFEKYDVENVGSLAGGGEYAVQDGFGWSNAVILKFMNQMQI